MMKRIKTFLVYSFLVLFLCSLFACASTKTESPAENPTPQTLEQEETSTKEEEEIQEQTEQEAPEEVKPEEVPPVEITEKENELCSSNFETPQDIEEPLVDDIELPPEEIIIEPEPEILEEEEPVVISEEPVIADETLLPKQEPSINQQEQIALEQKFDEAADTLIQGQDSETETLQSEENLETGTEAIEENTTEEITEPESEPEPEPVPSRSVTMRRGETLVVVYPGSGWIYMGSTSEYNNLASKGRKLGSTDTKYTLLAKEAGTQLHHFYKVDNLTGEYIDDYLEVIVLDKKGSSKTTVTAPDYATIIPPKAEVPAKAAPKTSVEESEIENEKSASPVQEIATQKEKTEKKSETKQVPHSDEPVIQYYVQKPESEIQDETDGPIFIDDSDEVELIDIDQEEGYSNQHEADSELLLKQAQELFDSKDYERAYLVLLDFFEFAQDNRDKGLYLKGQILEADSSIKDIKNSVKSYQELTDNYPSSNLWDKANKRIIYLKRFYIEVR